MDNMNTELQTDYRVRMDDLRNHRRLRRKNRDGADVGFWLDELR